MSEPHLDNPAGRLRNYVLLLQRNDQSISVLQGWAQVFGLNYPADLSLLFPLIAQVCALPGQIRQQVESLPHDNPVGHLQHFAEYEAVIGNFTNSGITVQAFLSPLTPTGLLLLGMCDDLLHSRLPEPTLSDAGRQELIDQARNLIDAVRHDPDLDQAAKVYLLGRLDDVQRALINVDLTGTAVLLAAVDQAAGSVTTVNATTSGNQPILDRITAYLPTVIQGLKVVTAGYLAIHNPEAGLSALQALHQTAAPKAITSSGAKDADG